MRRHDPFFGIHGPKERELGLSDVHEVLEGEADQLGLRDISEQKQLQQGADPLLAASLYPLDALSVADIADDAQEERFTLEADQLARDRGFQEISVALPESGLEIPHGALDHNPAQALIARLGIRPEANLQGRLADHLLVRMLREPLGRSVHLHDASVGHRGQEEGVGARTEDRGEFLLGETERVLALSMCLLHLLPLAQVGDQRGETTSLRTGDVEEKVLPDGREEGLEGGRLTGLGDTHEEVEERSGLRAVEPGCQRSRRFRARYPGEALPGRVHVQEPIVHRSTVLVDDLVDAARGGHVLPDGPEDALFHGRAFLGLASSGGSDSQGASIISGLRP